MKKLSTLLAVVFCVSSSLVVTAALACGDKACDDKACARVRKAQSKSGRKVKCSKCAEPEKAETKAETKAEAKPEVAPEAAQPAKG